MVYKKYAGFLKLGSKKPSLWSIFIPDGRRSPCCRLYCRKIDGHERMGKCRLKLWDSGVPSFWLQWGQPRKRDRHFLAGFYSCFQDMEFGHCLGRCVFFGDMKLRPRKKVGVDLSWSRDSWHRCLGSKTFGGFVWGVRPSLGRRNSRASTGRATRTMRKPRSAGFSRLAKYERFGLLRAWDMGLSENVGLIFPMK